MDSTREIELFKGYHDCHLGRGIIRLGSVAYTDGEVLSVLNLPLEQVDGFYKNRRVSSDVVNLLDKKTIKIKDAKYVIYVYYKAVWKVFNGCCGWFHTIADIDYEIFDKKDKVVLKECLKTLWLLKKMMFMRDIGILETDKSPVIYEDNDNVYTLSFSKYRK